MQTRYTIPVDSLLITMLDLLGNVAVIGALICMWLLLQEQAFFVPVDIVLYFVWFIIALLSVLLMRRGDIWGAYALGVATLSITVFDLFRMRATLGGALLGIIVMTIVLAYITTYRKSIPTREALLTN